MYYPVVKALSVIRKATTLLTIFAVRTNNKVAVLIHSLKQKAEAAHYAKADQIVARAKQDVVLAAQRMIEMEQAVGITAHKVMLKASTKVAKLSKVF